MKRILLSISILALSVYGLNSQSIDEAIKYSRLYYGGTARFQAMGGAFTSLGGDLSVLSQNPAGLALFRSAEVSFTPQMYFNNSESEFGRTGQDYAYNLNINQFGMVLPLSKGNGSSGLVSLNLAYSYNRTNNFYENAVIRGVLESSSMVDYFMGYAQGTHYTELSGGEGIVFDTFMYDTINAAGDTYASVFSNYGNDANSTYGQNVRRIINSEGYSGEHSFSAGTNFNDKIYLGFTFGITSMYSYLQYEHMEDDPQDYIFDFNRFTYSDVVETYGKGYSVKIGAIVRPIEILRVGVAVHSPVVYRLNEYYYDSATGLFDNNDYFENSNNPFRFSYTLTTPLRFTTGASLQLGKKGIVSADYEIIDYRMARYSNASDDYNYYVENQDIKDIFDTAHNLRMGGEFRVTSSFYLRGGYSRYGSGFTKGEVNEDNSHSVYSAGIGMRHSNFYLDLSYSLRTNTAAYFMYQHPQLDPATIKYDRNMISATIGFRM